MAGIGHRGMFRRKVENNFRYLNDEISGGIVSFSHLKTKASYSGDCFSILSNGFGFNENNFADLASAILSYPGTSNPLYFDQLENYNSDASVDGWNGSDFMINKGIRLASFEPLNSLSPFTVFLVLNKISDNTGIEECFFNLTGAGYAFSLFFNTTNLLRVGWLAPSVCLNNYSGIRNSTTGSKIICVTYDGSELLSGVNVYINNMSTPLSVSSTTGAVPPFTSATFGSAGFFSRQGGGFPINNSHNSDALVFNSELSELDREKTKEILEQYYTFS